MGCWIPVSNRMPNSKLSLLSEIMMRFSFSRRWLSNNEEKTTTTKMSRTCSLSSILIATIVLNLVLVSDIFPRVDPFSADRIATTSRDAAARENHTCGDVSGKWPVTCRTSKSQKSCELTGDVRIDPNSPTVYYIVPSEANSILQLNTATPAATIRPYARNWDGSTWPTVTPWSIKFVTEEETTNRSFANCSEIHDSPGVLFSLGGHSGNYFHAFTDILVPLFTSTRPFDRGVKLVTTNHKSALVSRFRNLLEALSMYEVLDIDKEQKLGNVHCFPRLIVGLQRTSGRELHIEKSDSERYTIADFRQLLRSAYSLNRTTAVKLNKKKPRHKPGLFIVNRLKTRTIENVGEIARLGRELGFEVVVEEPGTTTSVARTAEVVNSCDVMVGVHGAGITNMVFLPDDAIVIQVVALDLKGAAAHFFKDPSKDMNIRYLEYRIDKEESSLWRDYPHNHTVFTNPGFYFSKGYSHWSDIYLQNQNVTINVTRFRRTLSEAFELLGS